MTNLTYHRSAFSTPAPTGSDWDAPSPRSAGATILPWLIFIWLVFQCGDGAIRYGCVMAGVPFAIYFRDALCVFCLAWGAWTTGATPPLIATLVVLAFGAVVGKLYLSTGQVLFGLKMCLPFVAGVCLGGLRLVMAPMLKRAIVLLFLIHIGTVIANQFVEYPWIGFNYDLGSVKIEGNRRWWTLDDPVARLSGWSRISAEAATYAALLGLFVTMHSRLITRLAVWGLVAYIVVLTTTKGALLSCVAMFPFVALGPRYITRARWPIEALAALIVASAMVVVAAPVIAIFFRAGLPASGTKWLTTETINMRLEESWPTAAQMLAKRGSVMFGRGVGGTSTVTVLFEPENSFFTDSMFLHLYLQFGVLGGIFPLVYAAKMVRHRSGGVFGVSCLLIALFMLSYGVTQDVTELALDCACLGFTWTAITREDDSLWPDESAPSRREPRTGARSTLAPRQWDLSASNSEHALREVEL